MTKAIGYAATFFHRHLTPKKFEREDPGAKDVELDLLYCGVCHSDVHQVNNDWKNTVWPCVPGHEVIGKVSRVGKSVTKFKVGDLAAVGCIIDSCGTCYSCKNGQEQYCEAETGFLGTYNGPMLPTLQNTYGGYSNVMVVKEDYVLHLPKGIPPEVAGPILCAGVTTYSPLKHWGVKEGMKVGVIGLGGLGHMAVQLAKAMGAEVTVISTTPEKEEDAFTFGASSFVLSTDKDQMKDAAKSLDFILNTIPEKHKIEPYLDLLHRDGAMTVVGVLVPEPGWNPQKVIMHRRSIAGSLIGSIQETQEVLDFCDQHRIFPKVEVIEGSKLMDVYKKIEKKEARYRYVLDLASLKAEKREALDEIKPVSHLLDLEKKVLMPEPPVHADEDRKGLLPTWSKETQIAARNTIDG